VIDHGNGEFSMIAHLQKGSVRVKPGDTVRQGQVVGLMGNSGDTSGPHVHYQLQSGPDWERSDALPSNFTNVQTLAPGSYFEAR
jgi:murein DD-endopeptidase MepM/ murein hydrolase activator NlpD